MGHEGKEEETHFSSPLGIWGNLSPTPPLPPRKVVPGPLRVAGQEEPPSGTQSWECRLREPKTPGYLHLSRGGVWGRDTIQGGGYEGRGEGEYRNWGSCRVGKGTDWEVSSEEEKLKGE